MATPAVSFDYSTWVVRYPEFTNVPQSLAQLYFNEAGLYFANDTLNPAFCAGVLPALLDQLTAHVAQLNAPRSDAGDPALPGQPASPLVGRISTASEGSVSVSTEYQGSGSPSEAWFVQTRYGAAFWQASQQFRAARYFANPTTVFGGLYPVVYAGARRWGFR